MRCVAIYARYSDDRQNPRSCEDQIAELRRHAARRGWTVVATYQDDAISGFAMVNRPGILAARAAALRGEFEILLIEDESRISRNLGQLATLRDDLLAAGVTLATLSTDSVEIMHVAFKGAFAQQYLVDLGMKTRRGMAANAERGLATGARKYGYVTAPGGAVAIEPDEAARIVRIFELYADEKLAAREIAERLNGERVPGPTGGWWNASTIIGEKKRGCGILRSELYAGVKVWNRDDVRKDPRTGKRVHHYRPEGEWRRTPVAHLRIVPAELWDRAQDRLTASALVTPQRQAAHRKGLLSGLIKCGVCGASYTSYSKTRLVCAARRERGAAACANGRMIPRALVEQRALDGLRTRLLAPAYVRAYVRAYHAAFARLEAAKRNARAPLERRLAELTRGVGRLVDAVAAGADTPAMIARLKSMEADKAAVEAELRQAPPAAPIALHPGAAGVYVGLVERLQDTLAELAGAAADRKLIDAVRALIDKIEVIPDAAAPGGAALRLHGNLSLLLAPVAATVGQTPSRLEAGCLLVAGGGLGQTPTARPPCVVIDLPLLAEAA